MGIYTLRPNANTAAGNMGVTGAATAWQATSDDSDSSWIYRSNPACTGYCLAGHSFTDPVIPALAQIRSITPRWRLEVTGTADSFAVGVAFYILEADLVAAGYPDADYWVTALNQIPSPYTKQNGSGAPITTGPVGAWDVPVASLLRMTLYRRWGDEKVYELYADVAYNEAPVATVVAPTATVATTRPLVDWDYSDPEADVQERYHTKVFSAAQYGAGGFDPATSTATWDSLPVMSGASEATVGADLANGTYRAYVKVADAGSTGRYGNWAYSQFIVDTTPPPTPTLVAVVDSPLARVGLTAVGGVYALATQQVIVERSTDAGTTWMIIRGANEAAWTDTGTRTWVGYDYELPRALSALYRARTVADPAGGRVASAYSASDDALLATAGWWLKDPVAPGLNMVLEATPPFEFRDKEPQAVYEPLGANVSVVVTDGPKGIEGTLNVRTRSQVRYDKLRALLANARPLWLEDVLGRWWYVKFGSAVGWRLVVAAPHASETTPLRHLHEVSLPFTQVGRPTGDTVAAGAPT